MLCIRWERAELEMCVILANILGRQLDMSVHKNVRRALNLKIKIHGQIYQIRFIMVDETGQLRR